MGFTWGLPFKDEEENLVTTIADRAIALITKNTK
jgi:hypothetical protein